MSYDPLGLLNHRHGEIERTHSASHGSSGFSQDPVVNGGHASRLIDGEKKRNYKLLIDPVLKGRGHQKIYRFDGDFEGQPPVIPKDPRSRRTRLWSTRTKADLPVPKFKIDKFYVGIPPQRDVILNGLNDNVDKKFLSEICEKFGQIEGVKIFYDPLTKRHMGKARVGFSTSASAKLAVAKLDGSPIMGCVVHADFEHKVEIKGDHTKPEKSSGHHHGTDLIHTSPIVEKPALQIHHVLPTPPLSAHSSHSPTNSTPSTPGSLGLIDPRTRGMSTSYVSTEKLRSTPPLAWPQNPIKQPTKKTGIFEPISPPCQRVNLPPPPPPEVPPPAISGRSPSSTSGGKSSKSTNEKYHGTSRDPKSQESTSKYPRDSYKGGSRQGKDCDWRRRDRDSGRDRYDDRYDSHSSYRSRWSSDGRGNYGSYHEKESRYSSNYRDYSPHGRSDSRDGSARSESRRLTYSRDKDNRRTRDTDNCHEKGERKLKYDHVSPDDREQLENKGEKVNLESKERFNTQNDQKIGLDISDNNLNTISDSTLSVNTITLPQSLEDIVPSVEDDNPLSWDLFADQMLELNRTAKLEEKQQIPTQSTESSKKSHEKRPHENTHGDTTGVLEQSASQDPPIYEDISPVSSPKKPKLSAHVYPVSCDTVAPQSLPETETSVDMMVDQGTNEDNDDAMSLSSISSNEVEVAEPKSVPSISVPPPNMHYPPPGFVASVPPPPFMPRFDPTVPPPSMPPISMLHPMPITVPPPTIPPPPIQTHPHPLVPPSFHPVFPPQFVPTHTGVPLPPIQQPYQVYPTGPPSVPSACEPPKKKTWKIKISEEVLDIMSKELGVILKRDVTKRLVENSAFKALDGWWDNLGKSKLKTSSNQSESTTVTTTQPSILSSTAPTAMTMTSSPFFSTASMNQGGLMGIGLRATLPKMPSFRRRQPPSDEDRSSSKRKRGDLSGKSELTGSDSETTGSEIGGPKRMRHLDNGDSVGSPWQQEEDSIDGPPATSVRTEEKHPTVGSSLYSNIYSSLSESESSDSGDESESSQDDRSDWDESDESGMSSESGSEYSSDDEDELKTTKGLPPGLPRTPPGTPPETPPATPPHFPRTPSITPPASPMESGEEFVEKEDTVAVVKTEDKEDGLGLSGIEADSSDTTTEVTGYTSEELKSTISEVKEEQVGITVDKSSTLEDSISKDSKDIQEHIESAQESTADESKAQTEGPVSTKVKSPQAKEEVPDEPEIDVIKETKPDDDVYKPLFEMPPEFPVRPYWQDDQLVYNFLVSGLDYEDASYLKIGFENLLQVGSDSVADGHWSFHPTTSLGVVPKGRKQKSETCGVRVHASGSARCEGYYKLSMNEKAKYLEAARRQVDRTQEVNNKKNEEQEANKAKQQSRENRALQRRLAASFQNEDFGDILKFNQLKVRKKKLTFCKSSIHDWGLFALEPIGPDEMVIEYVGEVVRQAIADDREKRYERLGIGSSYLFRVDSDTILDATKFGNLARFINHCCEPNCYAKVVTLESEKKIVIYSKRDIAVNEEITYDYKFPIEDEKIPCLCGAAQCRGTLN